MEAGRRGGVGESLGEGRENVGGKGRKRIEGTQDGRMEGVGRKEIVQGLVGRE